MVQVLTVSVQPTVAPAVAELGRLPVAVQVTSELFGDWSGESVIDALDYEKLDVLEDWVNAQPADAEQARQVAIAQSNLKLVGGPLFEATLGRWGQWSNLLDAARQRGERLRIEIRTASGVLAAQPWELLYDANSGSFLALEPGVSVSRNPSRTGKTRGLGMSTPLRVLLVGSTPADLGAIAVDDELSMLRSVFNGFGGAVDAWTLSSDSRICTFAALTTMITDNGPWHIVHFSGHGGFEPMLEDGMLAFTTDDGSLDRVSASRFGMLLASHVELRLVVINACRGAMGVGRQAVNSVAGSLVQKGVPACVSMQFEVTDAAAVPFARAFHTGIMDHGDVERATMEGRAAVSEVSIAPALSGGLRSSEWATPVFHLDAHDTVLFPRPDGPATVVTPRPPDEPRPQAVPSSTSGSLAEIAAMTWQLTYVTSLDAERALGRAEAAVRTACDVRKVSPRHSGFEALAGGVFPGSWAATQRITVEVQAGDRGTTVTVSSGPKQLVLADQGMNRQTVERIAHHLGVIV